MTINSDEALARNQLFYDANACAYCQATEMIDMGLFYKRLTKYIRPCGKLLDAGCGSGRDSLILSRDFGLEVVSIDASAAMVQQARLRGVPAQQMSLQDLAWSEAFDAIWASAVLLHIPILQMDSVLGKLWSALKANGVMFISLKHGSGELIDEDGRFFSYFSEREFRLKLSAASFTILEDWQPSSSDGYRPWMQFIVRRA